MKIMEGKQTCETGETQMPKVHTAQLHVLRHRETLGLDPAGHSVLLGWLTGGHPGTLSEAGLQ